MVQSLEGSLKRLHTDYIDLFWLHAWDFTTPVEEVMRSLDDLVRQRLNEVSKIEPGFPHDFLASDMICERLFGGTYGDLELVR